MAIDVVDELIQVGIGYWKLFDCLCQYWSPY